MLCIPSSCALFYKQTNKKKAERITFQVQTWATEVLHFYFFLLFFLSADSWLLFRWPATPALSEGISDWRWTQVAGLSWATHLGQPVWHSLLLPSAFASFIWQVTVKFPYNCTSFWQTKQLPALNPTGQMSFTAFYVLFFFHP